MRRDAPRMASFTSSNLLLWSISLVAGKSLRVVSHACYICACGVAVSFTLAPLLDHTVFDRQREKLGVTYFEFHSGNVLLHFMPLWLFPCEDPVSPYAVLLALLWHTGWGTAASGGTLCCDAHYAALSRRNWHILWCVSWTVEVLTGLLLSASVSSASGC